MEFRLWALFWCSAGDGSKDLLRWNGLEFTRPSGYCRIALYKPYFSNRERVCDTRLANVQMLCMLVFT